MSSLQKLYVKELPPEEPPYEVDNEIYRRFDQKNNLTVGRPKWDEKVREFTSKTVETRVKKIKTGKTGYQAKDYSLFLAGGVTTFRLETAINNANRVFTSWSTLGNKLPPFVEKWEGTAVLIGLFEKPEVSLPANLFIQKEITLTGSQGYCWDFQTALTLVKDDRLSTKPLITHVIALEEIQKGFEILMNPEEKAIKVVVRFELNSKKILAYS